MVGFWDFKIKINERKVTRRREGKKKRCLKFSWNFGAMAADVEAQVFRLFNASNSLNRKVISLH